MARKEVLATAFGALCIFVIARLIFAGTLTVAVNEGYWQLTAPAWITGKSLWSTVLSFHAQPPGLLTMQWLAANLSPKIIDLSLLLAAAVYVCSCGLIAATVTNSRVVGLLTALVISFQPSTLLYSHWFFSPIYLAAFVSVSLLLVLAWARSGNAVWLAWTACLLSLASLFHSAYLAAFVCFFCLALLYPPIRRLEFRRPGFVIPLAFAASIAVFAPVKNFIVFGFFSASSWAPLNLANVYTTEKYIWQNCQATVRKSGRRPNDYGASKAANFSDMLNQDMLFRPVKPGGAVNLNHLDVTKCREAARFIEQFDIGSAVLNTGRAMLETIALPAWDYQWLGTDNLEKIEPIVRLYELYISRANDVEYRYYVNIEKRPDNWLESLPSLSSILFSTLVIFGCVTLLAEFAQHLRYTRKDTLDEAARRQLAQVYPCLLALLLLSIFVFASAQELNRIKFGLSPLFIAIILEGKSVV